MLCSCRFFYNHSTNEYNRDIVNEYQNNPCKEFLVFNEADSEGLFDAYDLFKTAFSLKHWAFVAALKFLCKDGFSLTYRENYLTTLIRIVTQSPMCKNFGFKVRIGTFRDRETYSFMEILQKGLTLHRFLGVSEQIFPSYYNFTPFCSCNLRVKFLATVKNENDPTHHFLSFSKRRCDYEFENVERNGHYVFCPRSNNKIIFY